MQSKNKLKPSAGERLHIAKIKLMPCIICQASPPSECHEINQGQWFTSMPLCADCHRGSLNGIHGQRRLWNVYKMDELSALNETIRRICEEMPLKSIKSPFQEPFLPNAQQGSIKPKKARKGLNFRQQKTLRRGLRVQRLPLNIRRMRARQAYIIQTPQICLSLITRAIFSPCAGYAINGTSLLQQALQPLQLPPCR